MFGNSWLTDNSCHDLSQVDLFDTLLLTSGHQSMSNHARIQESPFKIRTANSLSLIQIERISSTLLQTSPWIHLHLDQKMYWIKDSYPKKWWYPADVTENLSTGLCNDLGSFFTPVHLRIIGHSLKSQCNHAHARWYDEHAHSHKQAGIRNDFVPCSQKPFISTKGLRTSRHYMSRFP